MIAAQERRLGQFRARHLVRAWRYRQRRHAGGVWFRLRRVLAESETAFAIAPDEVRQLIAEGLTTEPVGDELEPRKWIAFVSKERVACISGKRSVPVRLGADLLAAECLALTRFD